MKVVLTKRFDRELKKIPLRLRPETEQKVELFLTDPHHPSLKTHKLSGQMKNFWSFSVNFKTRIIFKYLEDGTIAFLSIGDHSTYD
ncbi:MAG: type II toxin-antitoxin system mRNA interferase toxin, RelE/StbE family [Candidatus Uhrbacteria bacterium]